MNEEMLSFVERYQLLYEKDPSSKVFAPLAEAYRRMGLVEEAIDLASRGVEQHPHFASGRVALGKCYVQTGKYSEAAEQLKAATELSPENLLAHQLLAECFSKLGQSANALNAYKIVLFLNPNDGRIAQIVKELEIKVYAGHVFEEEEYAMGAVQEIPKREAPLLDDSAAFEKDLALYEAYCAQEDWTKAKELLESLLLVYPDEQKLLDHKKLMDQRDLSHPTQTQWITPLIPDMKAVKIKKLKTLIERIESRKNLI
jgi:tetratricopeptide (TPR) repeat protein